jgi:Flp pilus assembly protein TadB
MQVVQRLAAMTKQVQGEEEKKISSMHLVQQQQPEEEEEEQHEQQQQRVRAVMTELHCTTDETKSLGSTVSPHHAFVFFFFFLVSFTSCLFSPVGDSRLVPYPFPTRGN